jgi:hypothetical protein
MIEHPTAVKFDSRVKDGISREILQAAGSEIGGILLGRRAADQVLVEDFEPVPCQHRFGLSYFLSDEDLRGLAESVEWFRALPASQAGSGLEVLGFYRSQARPDGSWHERDEDLMRRYFAHRGSLLALLRPNRSQAFDAELFFFDEGSLRPRPALPAPTRPRHVEPEEAPDRSWWWVAALVALTLVGAVLGYRSAGPPAASPPVQPAPQAPAAAVHQPPGAANERQAGRPVPLPVPLVEQSIQAAIERWQNAILSGDPDLIAACYAPRVRQAAMQTVQQQGKPSILRISGLTILPVAPDRAVATFRKHWQTRGPDIFAGEAQARLAFVLAGDGPPDWKIVSEEETKVYWTQRPRRRGPSARR